MINLSDINIDVYRRIQTYTDIISGWAMRSPCNCYKAAVTLIFFCDVCFFFIVLCVKFILSASALRAWESSSFVVTILCIKV